MATFAFKKDEARAFWCASYELRQALRDHAPRQVIDALTAVIETHARRGIQPGIRQRADSLLAHAQCAALTG